ncbi:MAG: SPFH domain-containing protein [Cyclobacteriaceae bacterium]
MDNPVIVFVVLVLVVMGLLTQSFGIAKEWEKHAVFFLGKLSRIVGPGIYLKIPILESVFYKVDTRIITYAAPLQKGLTQDNIPVEVDAVVFYKVKDPREAMLNVEDYHEATKLRSRSALRDMVGKSTLDQLLSKRNEIGKLLQKNITEFVGIWGIEVLAVEIKDVIVSKDLEDAIAREAAAEREKRARIKLSEAEDLSANAFITAANKYENNAIALQLRSMNMLYEICLEGKSTMVFVPTDNANNGMPGIIGLESYKDLIEKHKAQSVVEKQTDKEGQKNEEEFGESQPSDS